MLDNSDPLSLRTHPDYKGRYNSTCSCTRISTINECQSSRQEVVEDERVVEYMAPSSNGLGGRPLTPIIRVRISSGSPRGNAALICVIMDLSDKLPPACSYNR